MSVSVRTGEVTGPWRQATSRSLTARSLGRWLTGAALVFAVFLSAGVLGLGLYASAHDHRIYEGVEVAGVRVGGMTEAEARAALEARFATYATEPLSLVAGEQTFTVTPGAAGARLDGDASVAAAFAYGRSGSIWDRSRAWASGLLRRASVEPRVVVDPAAVDAQLRAIAPSVVRPPVDAAIRMDGAGQPELVPDVAGVTLDLSATRAALIDRISRLGTDPVPMVTRPKAANVPASALAPRLEAARAAVGTALVLSAEEGVWHVGEADLKRIVSVEPTRAELRVDRAPLTALVEGLAAEIDHAPTDAGITVDEAGALAVVPGTDLARVDVPATVEAIAAALVGGRHDVPLAVERAVPAITDAMAATAAAEAEALIGGGLDLVWDGGRARFGRDDLLRALTITPQPGQAEPFASALDEAVVAELLSAVAARFDKPAVDARFRLVDGRITLVSEAEQGRALDVDQGVEDVVATFGDPDPEVRLAVKGLEPAFTAADRESIRLGDQVLAEASTYYGQSSEPRRRNVERAVELETGWLVPPGGVFSYVENVGAVDASNGFVTGFGIVADEDGGVTTAPVIGGGICQVSTTIFQAAFWAGMPIVERSQHPYYLRSYGEAPRGLPGLDAMVNIEEDWAIDLKFENATDDWLAVILVADGQNVTARLVGTDPGWEVEVGEPEITKLVPKDEQMHYTDSPELPRGQELLVESAEDGFDSRIERTVRDGGTVIDEYTVESSFLPARNLTLRGTGR